MDVSCVSYKPASAMASYHYTYPAQLYNQQGFCQGWLLGDWDDKYHLLLQTDKGHMELTSRLPPGLTLCNGRLLETSSGRNVFHYEDKSYQALVRKLEPKHVKLIVGRSCVTVRADKVVDMIKKMTGGLSTARKRCQVPRHKKVRRTDVSPVSYEDMEIDEPLPQDPPPPDPPIEEDSLEELKALIQQQKKPSRSKKTAKRPPKFANEELYQKAAEQLPKIEDSILFQGIENLTMLTASCSIDISKLARDVNIQKVGNKVIFGGGRTTPADTPAPSREEARVKLKKKFELVELPDDEDGLDMESEEVQKCLLTWGVSSLQDKDVITEWAKLLASNASYSEKKQFVQQYNPNQECFRTLRDCDLSRLTLAWLSYPWVHHGLLPLDKLRQECEREYESLHQVKIDRTNQEYLCYEAKKIDNYQKKQMEHNEFRLELTEIKRFQRLGPKEDFHFYCSFNLDQIGRTVTMWVPYFIFSITKQYLNILRHKYRWYMSIERYFNFEDDQGNDFVDPDFDQSVEGRDTLVQYKINAMTPTQTRIAQDRKKQKAMSKKFLLQCLEQESRRDAEAACRAPGL